MSDHVVIIGNGISGITAARHIRKKSNMKITVISKESDHFYSRTALMYIFMGHMRYKDTKPYEDWFWEKNRIDLINDFVTEIDTDTKTLKLQDKGNLTYDKLIIAVGSRPNKFGWPGQDLDGVQGLYSLQDLELMEEKTKGISSAVIVGGGLIGVEMAEMLLSRDIKVTMLVREKNFWNPVLPVQESEMIAKHIESHHVDLRLQTELSEIIADENGKVKSLKTSKDEEIPCQFVGLTVGVTPNIKFVESSKVHWQIGVMVNEYLESSIPDVYAIGDCAEFKKHPTGRRHLEQVWYTGKMMGETVAETITGNKTIYNPGIWFNSAKFFDIEYQTYGSIKNKLEENETEFYWEHEDEQKCIHIVFDKETRSFLGINAFGIRIRHNVMDRWLASKMKIDEVMSSLRDANFDPEFYKLHEQEIVDQFNQENNTNIQLKKKSWKRIFSRS
ncbi:MAG: NAD(P)/FAD-dependent oxidoreductase [Flavobacteriales bacterium]|nr:NAD(P)/FAD-dependent oxidoreductase [Flavobacteriales bacterium]